MRELSGVAPRASPIMPSTGDIELDVFHGELGDHEAHQAQGHSE